MQSITSNPHPDHTDGTRPEPLQLPEPRTDDQIELGLQVLIELISLVEQPADLDEERAALLALRTVHENTRLGPRGEALRLELDRCVQLAHQSLVQNLIDWIDQPARGTDRLRPVMRTRRHRLLLLFILLAKSVGRVHEYQIPGFLQDMTPHAWAERLDCDLNWLPRYLGGRCYFEVADLYLEVTQQILFENLLIDPEGLTTSEFENWPWMRQILHLRGWRASWSLHQTTNPAFHASRFEFQLARRRSFRTLARKGGLLAHRSLRKLEYGNLPRRETGWPRLRIAVVGILVGLSVAGWWHLHHEAHALTVENNTIVDLVEDSLAGEESEHE